jgi:hypothetical protein
MAGRSFIAVAVAGAAALAACAEWGSGPTLTGATQNNVSVRYDATEVDPKEADAAAQAWCRWYGREAKLRNRFALKPQMTYANYACFDAAAAAANAKSRPPSEDVVPVLPPARDSAPAPEETPEPGPPAAAPRPAVAPEGAPREAGPSLAPPRSSDTID